MALRYFKIAFLTFVCVSLLISKSYAQDTHNEKHIEVSLRMIGHQVLLNSNDSTSRVLPILKEKDQYRIQFESEFELNPDDLVKTVNRVFKDSKMALAYFIEVEECETGEVVYSYEMGLLDSSNVIPCQARTLPKSCYTLLFTLTETIATKDTSTPKSSKDSTIEKSQVPLVTTVIVLVLMIVVFIFIWKRRKTVPIDPNVISLGIYHFDIRKSELILKEQRIELTSKEADLLLLLYNAVNTTVEREVILNMVWGDEGDYIGRTLDVFISKLRKKLEADSSLKIVNIRGVGYKLVMD